MKKILCMVLTCLLFVSYINAEQCEVVSGSGKKLGDEINCKGEHFYVIEYKNDDTRLLSKYNLYVGNIITTYKLSDEVASSANNQYCKDTYGNEFNYYPYTKDCMKIEDINESEIKQNSRAIGAHGDEIGKPAPEEVAIVDISPRGVGSPFSFDGNNLENITYDENFADADIVEGRHMDDYLKGYTTTLNGLQVTVKKIDLPSVKDVKNVIAEVTDKKLKGKNISEWQKIISNYGHPYYVVEDLKEYLGDKHPWLYSTTYWTKTFYPGASTNFYFIDTLGDLCTGDVCDSVVGAGVRPIITISNSNIIYPYTISKKTDGNGSIEVVDSAYADDVITFRVTPKKNYKLKSLTITDNIGNSVTFKEDQIIQNNDGTVSVNSFTMPSSNVTIIANFTTSIVNPKTGMFFPIIIILVLLTISSLTLLIPNKTKSL